MLHAITVSTRDWSVLYDNFRQLLAQGLERHPALTLAAVLALAGGGMVLAVSLATLAAVLPLGLLLGWF